MNLSYEEFKTLFEQLKGEPEISLFIGDKEYMLIKYDGYVTFQESCDEVKYNNIDETPIKAEWNNIKDIVLDNTFSFNDDEDLETIKDIIKG